VLWHCLLGVRKSIWPVKIVWWGAGIVVCLERGANDLYMVHPIISCFSKIQHGLPFWCRLIQVVREKRPLNRCSSSTSSSSSSSSSIGVNSWHKGIDGEVWCQWISSKYFISYILHNLSVPLKPFVVTIVDQICLIFGCELWLNAPGKF